MKHWKSPAVAITAIPMSEDSLVYGTARRAECARISVKLGDQSITTHNDLPGKDNVSRVMSSVSWTPFRWYITQWSGGGGGGHESKFLEKNAGVHNYKQ